MPCIALWTFDQLTGLFPCIVTELRGCSVAAVADYFSPHGSWNDNAFCGPTSVLSNRSSIQLSDI